MIRHKREAVLLRRARARKRKLIRVFRATHIYRSSGATRVRRQRVVQPPILFEQVARNYQTAQGIAQQTHSHVQGGSAPESQTWLRPVAEVKTPLAPSPAATSSSYGLAQETKPSAQQPSYSADKPGIWSGKAWSRLLPGASPKTRYLLLRKRLWLSAVIVLVVFIQFRDSNISQQSLERELAPIVVAAEQLPHPQQVIDQRDRVQINVSAGATFVQLMEAYPFSTTQVYRLLDNQEAVTWLAQRLRQGRVIVVDHLDWKIERLEYPIDLTRTLVALWDKQKKTFEVQIDEAPVVSIPAYVEGTINNSFYLDGLQHGMQESLVVSVATIFQWDLDFVNDIRKGDGFKVLYAREVLGEVELPPTKVMAAQFINRGKVITAVAYEFSEQVRAQYPQLDAPSVGYYNLEGRPMRKAFLRMPLQFGRISSRFNPNRIHPLFGTKRPHRGTDYAAPRHTPILAVANGRIKSVRWRTGYGRTIEINHGNDISTLYAHLQVYAKGMKAGVRVEQGQRIGTVGTSGWSTGPHVHFEFKVRGVHKNPETVKLPDAPPLPDGILPAYLQHKDKVMSIFKRFEDRENLRAGG